ncbi:hypothetical protein M9458_026983, partial [Cirrhinus mrigala]
TPVPQCTSLHSFSTGAFDAFRPEPNSSHPDLNYSKTPANDLSSSLNSNYLNNFFQLQRNE